MALGLAKEKVAFSWLPAVLASVHTSCSDSDIPTSVVPLKQMHEDVDFMNSMRDMTEGLATKQTTGLRLVMDKVAQNMKQKKVAALQDNPDPLTAKSSGTTLIEHVI